MANEDRKRQCWRCRLFVQNQAEYRNGICVKHPPQKVDETAGASVTGAPAGFKMFPNVIDSENAFCGQYVPADVPVSDTIPEIKPPS